MKRPSITVCIPTRNRAKSLRQTLPAIGRQTMPCDEIIIGDDASEDGRRS